MRNPLGREYNTDSAFRDLTRPAVLTNPGEIIEPIRLAQSGHGGGKRKGGGQQMQGGGGKRRPL